MRSQIVKLLLAALIGFMVLNQSEDDQHQCPHKNFLIKHVCTECEKEADALDFSQLRAQRLHEQRQLEGQQGNTRIKRNSLNTVIIGTPTFIEVGNRCVNENPVTAFKCRMKEGVCSKMGDNCLVKHHFTTGHLFPDEIECE